MILVKEVERRTGRKVMHASSKLEFDPDCPAEVLRASRWLTGVRMETLLEKAGKAGNGERRPADLGSGLATDSSD